MSGSERRGPRRKRGINLELESGSVQLKPGETYQPSSRQVDLCFVFDTTGSMNDKIGGLITCMGDLVRDFDQLALDWRLSVLPFGDLTVPGDRIVADRPFVTDRGAAEAELRQMVRNGGGGNDGESSIEAMEAALRKPYRSATVTILILLTDEPALTPSGRAAQLERQLRQQEVIVFAVSPDLPYYKSWAASTGGGWFPIAAAVDTTRILEMLRQLAADLARVAHEVHSLAGGSVAAYRELGRGQPS